MTSAWSLSRAELKANRHGPEFGIPDYIAGQPSDSPELGLDPQTITWPKILSAAGYSTGLIGKWHLGHTEDRFRPASLGYSYFMGFRTGGCAVLNPTLEVDGHPEAFKGF